MIKKSLLAISLLFNSPVLFFNKLIFKIKSFFPIPSYPVRKRINGINFEFDFTYDPAIRYMYLEIYEMPVVKIMKKILRKGDAFIDVGANIGYLSAIGAGLVGITGQVHSFEPVPKYFQKLEKLSELNPNYKIKANNYALGEKEDVAQINLTNFANIGHNTMVPGFMKPELRKESISIPVKRLDNYIKEQNLANITLIKIDVEGFEFPVLKGLKNCLINSEFRPVIVCEINPEVCSLMNYHLTDLFDYMKDFGYSSFDMNNQRINWSDIKELPNILFIPYK